MGIDPSDFAWTLAENAMIATNSNPDLSPVEITNRAYQQLVKDDMVKAGSSTCCVLALNNHILNYSNLGDSGFLLIRPPSNVLFRTTEQQHAFNTPYQLSYVSKRFSRTSDCITDPPRSAQQGSISVKKGDIVILATDGLFDNMFDEKIIEILEKNAFDLKMSSQMIVNEAEKKSLDTFHMSPFAKNAKRYGYYFPGGKPDDITVLIARIE